MADLNPDNNLANYLNDSFGVVSQNINTFGSVIGTIADLSGAIGGILAVVDFITSLQNSSPNPIQQIKQALQNDFAQLEAADKAQRIIDRWNSTQTDIAPAESVLESLSTLVQQLPLSPSEIATQLKSCLNAINILGYDQNGELPAWTAVYSDQIYWNDNGLYQLMTYADPDDSGDWVQWGFIDVGYGTLAPPAPSDDIVFNYRFVLVTYLQAVFIFVAVGKAIDPNFSTGYASALRTIAKLLSDVHDKILNEGIYQLFPRAWPSGWTTVGLGSLMVGEAGFPWGSGPPAAGQPYPPGVTTLSDPLGLFGQDPVTGLAAAPGLAIEYGAVETFSGYSSIGTYQIAFTDANPASSDFSVYNKFQIRLLRKLNDVYIGAGLLQVWTVTNKIKSLVGDPLIPPAAYGLWSFRQLLSIANIPADPTTNTFSLLSLAKFIKYTVPFDTAQDPQPSTSFRELLNH